LRISIFYIGVAYLYILYLDGGAYLYILYRSCISLYSIFRRRCVSLYSTWEVRISIFYIGVAYLYILYPDGGAYLYILYCLFAIEPFHSPYIFSNLCCLFAIEPSLCNRALLCGFENVYFQIRIVSSQIVSSSPTCIPCLKMCIL